MHGGKSSWDAAKPPSARAVANCLPETTLRHVPYNADGWQWLCFGRWERVVSGWLTRSQAILLGVLVVLGVSLGAVGLFAIGQREGLWHDYFTLSARFDRVDGVEAGTIVRIQGVRVGEVEQVEHPTVPGGDVILHLRVQRQFQGLLAEDAHAEIITEGLIGNKVVELHPGTAERAPIADGATIAGSTESLAREARTLAKQSTEVLREIHNLAERASATADEARRLIQDVRQGDGVVGHELTQALRELKQAAEALELSMTAMRDMPVVGKYVDSSTRTLVRPEVESYPFVFREDELFRPGYARLTAAGKRRLDALAQNQLPRFKVSGSEIVVAAYTSGDISEGAALILTQAQAQAVRDYLVEEHGVNRLGWWSRRDVTALGMGTRRPPVGNGTGPALPRRRLEVIVFVPPESMD